METIKFEETITIRITKEMVGNVLEMQKLYPEKYQSDSQVFRAALNRLYRKEVEEKYGKLRNTNINPSNF